MNELLDLFITAQEKNKEISQIIGNDIKSFCDNFFAEVPKISKIREFLDSLKQLAWVLVVLDVIGFLFELDKEEKSKSDFGGILCIFICTYVISGLIAIMIRKLIYNRLNIRYKVKRGILIATEFAVSDISNHNYSLFYNCICFMGRL